MDYYNDKIFLNWRYLSLCENGEYTEEMRISDALRKTKHYGFGEKLCNLYWIKAILDYKEHGENQRYIKELLRCIGFDTLKKEADSNKRHDAVVITTFYNYIGFCVSHCYKLLISGLRHIFGKRINCLEEVKKILFRIKNEEVKELTLEDMQDMADYFSLKFNRLFGYITQQNRNDEVFDDIMTIINDYKGTSKILSSYKKGCKEGKERCVATYVFNNPINEIRGYAAFSGYQDIKTSEFFEEIEKICKSLNVELVVTNDDVTLYQYKNFEIIPFLTFGEVRWNKELQEKYSGDFACCERKIFTKFPPRCYVGDLYVKFPPCEKCVWAINYPNNSRHILNVYCDR